MAKSKYIWEVQIDGVWEPMWGPHSTSRFWITGMFWGLYYGLRDIRYNEDPTRLRRS